LKQIRLGQPVLKELNSLSHRDKKLLKKIHKQLKLFEQNPKHKSLRLHKISKEVKNTWSISIDEHIRMLFIETGSEYYFFKIGTHDEVYK
jgi:mRNA-degrading endonuclease YafQ of YafQ-DinJ toxin-antitoxin module